MIRHVFKLIWNRKRTNFLMMTEIFVSFLVLFAVVALGVYTMDNWRRPLGYSIDRVWAVTIDMQQTSDDAFDESQQETARQLMLALREFPEIDDARWVGLEDARVKLVRGQLPVLDALEELLRG